MKSLLSVIAAAAGLGIVLAFFAPWVMVDAELAAPVGVFGKKVDKVTGTTVGSAVTNAFRGTVGKFAGRTRVAHMSGWQIARSERSEFLKFVSELTVVLGQKSKDPRQVLYLFLVPVGGAALALVIVLMGGIAALAAGVVSTLIGVVMGFKLLTSPLGNEVAQAHLLWGIWATVGLFLVLGAAGILKRQVR